MKNLDSQDHGGRGREIQFCRKPEQERSSKDSKYSPSSKKKGGKKKKGASYGLLEACLILDHSSTSNLEGDSRIKKEGFHV